jgi:hypothetical protein
MREIPDMLGADMLGPDMLGNTMMTRRRLLCRAGVISSAAACRLIADEPTGAVMTRLSAYMSEVAARPLPAEVMEKVKHHLLDTFAAMISGAELAPGRAAVQFARAYGGEKVATVAASQIVCGPIEAALANGCWRTPMKPTTPGPTAGIRAAT